MNNRTTKINCPVKYKFVQIMYKGKNVKIYFVYYFNIYLYYKIRCINTCRKDLNIFVPGTQTMHFVKLLFHSSILISNYLSRIFEIKIQRKSFFVFSKKKKSKSNNLYLTFIPVLVEVLSGRDSLGGNQFTKTLKVYISKNTGNKNKEFLLKVTALFPR